ncbi:replication initiation and membrane attachment family protein [Levilactobacillus bambusae]|uniref:Replication initiation/membrane attachment protein n=1 Tax=Levilactobacillus bambusae TaxID=2024736 RepID=A0A2V1N5H2_9LACO|nr:DnaD domain protein [Levilactobacillus bambusae]PWG01035.1 replication initiation/membrane attachment protein [Levilactobacillus bambusae]
MENSWHQLNLRSGFVASVTGWITDLDWQVLAQLYTPFIGSLSATVYTTLFWRFTSGEELQTHAKLQEALNVSLQDFYNARLRLEAAGLLTTRVSERDAQPVFYYQLNPPVDPGDFFNDDLLSVQLLSIVGESEYQRLVDHFTVVPESGNDTQNITKNFLEVFHPSDQQLNQLPDPVLKGRHNLTNNQPESNRLDQVDDFDFQLLGQMLEKSYINLDQLNAQRQLILMEHVTYGIDEIEMKRLIETATNIATNVFDPEQFKRLVVNQFNQSQRPVKSETQRETTSVVQPKVPATTGTEDQLIQFASALAPVNFLQALKNEQGGYVTDGEQRVVRNLVNRQLFAPSLINIMIYHLLVDENRPTLNKNLLDAIANDWARDKITTPQGAIAEIRKHQQQASQPKKTKQRSSRNQRQGKAVTETLPDWAKNPTTQSTEKLSSDEQEKLKSRIKAMRESTKNNQTSDKEVR